MVERTERNSAILILSHITNKQVEEHFQKIRQECSNQYNVISLCDNTSGLFYSKKNDHDYFLFSIDDLEALGFPGRSTKYPDEMRRDNPFHNNFNFKPGSADLAVLHYYRNNPNYDYYWLIEYDVRFTGRWNEFFALFEENESDLLGTTLTRYPDFPNWYHWSGVNFQDAEVPERERLRGFFPVYRLSRRALAVLDEKYRGNISGHYECLMPTILNREGLTLEDIGGDGEFVRPENINRCYRNTRTAGTLSPGTFVFRPVMRRPGREPGMLWHPVKYEPLWRMLLRKFR